MESNPYQDLLTARSRIPPFKHQFIGVEKIVNSPIFFLMDVMGLGKSKQTIDAAQILFTQGQIDRVLVVAPAAVRAVWHDPELGELAKHLWKGLNVEVIEYHTKIRKWTQPGDGPLLKWVITNFDFIRSAPRLALLLRYCVRQTLLVIDESSSVKNHKALQTKACLKLRKKVGRVLLLNGTPIANSPADMYSQGNLMDPAILGCTSYFHFRARYAVMGGFLQKQIIGWRDLEDLQQRFAPFVLRRLKADCLDLPPKLPSVTLTATLTDFSWGLYKPMRDDFVAWLDAQTVSAAPQAVVKALRLAQLTSGFLGGITDANIEEATDGRPAWLPFPTEVVPTASRLPSIDATDVRETGREKLDVFLEWLAEQLLADPNVKLLVWCRFRAEVARLLKELNDKPVEIGAIWGNQTRDERTAALRLLDPRTAPPGPVVVVGTPSSGSMGLNLAAAHVVVYMSNDYSLKVRLQSEDRVHRPGQIRPVSYFDVVAVGPKGQKTIDHAIQKALRAKDDLATWTTAAWIRALTEE